MTVNATHRERILRYATQIIVRPDDADAAVAAADVLLEWVGQAEDRADLAARMSALSLRYASTERAAPSGNPEGFLAGARTLYAFIVSGEAGPRTSADEILAEEGLLDGPDDDFQQKLRRMRELQDKDGQAGC